MKHISKTIGSLLLISTLSGSLLHAYEPQIKLSGRKDVVLSSESRQTVLRVGLKYLAEPEAGYLAEIEDLANPFGFKQAAATTVASVTEVEDEPEPVVIYDDAMVLEVSAVNFSKQVRGSITRGETTFLQLAGGTLLRPGTSIPVRLPQAEGQTFTLTVSEISSQGYTLRIGEATKRLTYEITSDSGTGSIKFSNP